MGVSVYVLSGGRVVDVGARKNIFEDIHIGIRILVILLDLILSGILSQNGLSRLSRVLFWATF